MTLDELRGELRGILILEVAAADWSQIEARCAAVVDRLNSEPEPDYPHDVVYHFLEDADARRKSPRYGDWQRQQLSQWLAGP